LGIPGESSSGGDEIRVVVPSTEGDGGVPRGRQLLQAVTREDAAGVFVEGDVADVVQLVSICQWARTYAAIWAALACSRDSDVKP